MIYDVFELISINRLFVKYIIKQYCKHFLYKAIVLYSLNNRYIVNNQNFKLTNIT